MTQTQSNIVGREAQEWFAAHEQQVPEINYQIEIMTPERAEQLLGGNNGNRRLRKAAVDNLAKSIKRGEWKVNHQAIAISAAGRVLDGQHRLWSIKNSGVPVPVVIAYHADEKTFDVIDTGVKRNVQDIVGGNRQVNQVASVLCRMLYNENDNSMQRVEEMNRLLGPIAAEVVSGAETLTRVNIAGIRAGFVLRSLLGNQRYIADLWHGLVLQKTESLPPIGHAFLRKINQSVKKRTGHSQESSNLAIGFDVSDITRRDQTRYNNPPIPATIEMMRKVLRAYLDKARAADAAGEDLATVQPVEEPSDEDPSAEGDRVPDLFTGGEPSAEIGTAPSDSEQIAAAVLGGKKGKGHSKTRG